MARPVGATQQAVNDGRQAAIGLSDVAVAGLRDRLAGPAFLPTDPGYEQECATYNLTTPLRPRLAIGATSAADVEAAVRFAAQHRLGVAVRGGGHVVAKQDEGVVAVNLSRMQVLH